MLAFRLIGLAAVIYGGYVLIQSSARSAKSQEYAGMAPADAATDVVARTIWGEARGEGAEGMQAVANVIVNRANRPGWWGTDFVSVCQKDGQFTCWNTGDPNLIKLLAVDASDPAFAAALEIATAAVSGDLPDITGGATNYFNPRVVLPSWAAAMTETAVIGNHAFFA